MIVVEYFYTGDMPDVEVIKRIEGSTVIYTVERYNFETSDYVVLDEGESLESILISAYRVFMDLVRRINNV